ncbi:MAG: PD40 domain-containing protein [Acidobacteria bacterium]|nr:PD40 domain-containing protein [Acidobacteriota bacterium]
MRRRIALLAVAVAVCWAAPTESGSPAPRLVWTGPDVTLLGGPSRDGRYLSYVDPTTRNLAIREIASGRSRVLTAKPAGSGEFAYFSAISPDSRRVAYAWFNEEGFYDLRVVDLNGSNQRILYRNEEAGFVQPCAWSPDSKFILTLLFRTDNISQITLVPTEGGPPKVLRSLNWVYPKRMDISPDGRFIVYDSFAGESSADRTLFLLSVDGARERKLVNFPGNHLFPLWMPDGKRIVYASDRSGTMDAWELGVENGEPRGEQRLLRRDLGRFLPMGITAGGDLYFGLRSGGTDVFIAKLGEPARTARRATLRFPGRNSAPAWSPDGAAIAYLSRRGSENFGQESRAIAIRSLDSDDERELLPKLAHLERVRWSPDGNSLLVSGSDNKGRAGLYIVDPKTATVQPLVSESGASFRGFDGVWSRDGRSVFYIHGDREVRSRAVGAGRESTIYRGARLRHLAASPDGKWLAAGIGDNSIALVPTAGGEPRMLPFHGLTELEWGRELVAGKGAELWRIPLGGEDPVKIESPGNRDAGFSLHPDGERIAVTAGNAKSEVWVLPLR